MEIARKYAYESFLSLGKVVIWISKGEAKKRLIYIQDDLSPNVVSLFGEKRKIHLSNEPMKCIF